MHGVIPRLLSFRVPRLWAIGVAVLAVLGLASAARAQSLAGGADHSVIVKSDGTVWAVGLNSNGQLGDNTTTARKTPVQVSGLSNVVAVAAGSVHNLALQADGTLWAWGDNQYGQIGDSTTTDRKIPTLVGLTQVVGMAAGEHHSVAVRANGEVYTWGRNASGQLADGGTTNSSSPVLVLTSGGAAVGAGLKHSLVVKGDGTVWAAGLNTNGQLGDGTTTSPRNSFVQMSGVSGALAAAGGSAHSLVLLTDGSVKATGLNSSGQLGDGTIQQRTSAISVSSISGATALVSGERHGLVRTASGAVWAWGDNASGRLGDGTIIDRSTPVVVSALSAIVGVGGGYDHSLAVDTDGVVFTWGENDNSQLGDGTTDDRATPDAISGPGYDWKVATPTFSVASGTYNTNRNVVVAVVTSGVTIHYTQDGSEPTEAHPTIASGGTIVVDRNQTLRARAWKIGMPPSSIASAAYDMRVGTPTFSPGASTYTVPKTVTIATSTPGATLRYTLDGSVPTESSPLYTSPLTIGTTSTLKAVGFKTDWTTSTTQSGIYNFDYGDAATPTIDPAGGAYESSVTVTLSSTTPGVTIRYTLDGATPGASSPVYTTPLVVEASATLKAKASHADYNTSEQSSATFTISVAAPVFSLAAGSHPAGQPLTIASSTPGATIRYTLNGVDPTENDPALAPGASLVVGAYTLKAKAWKANATPSAVVSAAYSISGGGGGPHGRGGRSAFADRPRRWDGLGVGLQWLRSGRRWHAGHASTPAADCQRHHRRQRSGRRHELLAGAPGRWRRAGLRQQCERPAGGWHDVDSTVPHAADGAVGHLDGIGRRESQRGPQERRHARRVGCQHGRSARRRHDHATVDADRRPLNGQRREHRGRQRLHISPHGRRRRLRLGL